MTNGKILKETQKQSEKAMLRNINKKKKKNRDEKKAERKKRPMKVCVCV